MKFKNKKVIITGANRSIGQAMAIDFASLGADVVISYRNDKLGAEKTIDSIQNLGGDAIAFYADFSSVDGVSSFAKKAISHLGHVDILVNNAGMLSREKIFDLTPEKMQLVFQVNTIAPLYLLQICSANMVENKIHGNIITISSISGSYTIDKGIGYAASKAAVNKFTKNAALDLGEYGIRVNAIAPGFVKSGMNENTAMNNPSQWDGFLETIPLKKFGHPDDISKMALFLSSDDAKWITGKVFEVDGGTVL